MFRKLAAKLGKMKADPVRFDATVIGDPLALRTEWTPAKGGGASFRTHRLAQAGPTRMAFQPTKGAMAFYALFLLIGVGLLVGFAVFMASRSDGATAIRMTLPILIGVVFTVAGAGMLYTGAAPIIFDTNRGEFWKGRMAPWEARNHQELAAHTPLDRIHALQIVSERVRSDDGSYESYELNLVLDDGSRLNVVDHGNLDHLRADACALSDFIGKPVWDATIDSGYTA